MKVQLAHNYMDFRTIIVLLYGMFSCILGDYEGQSALTLHGAHGVRLVNDDDVDVAELESRQGRPHRLDDVFPGETSLI